MAIALVHTATNKYNGAGTSSLAITVSAAASGNFLVVVVGNRANTTTLRTVSSITCTNATAWSEQKMNSESTHYTRVAIWASTVSGTSGTTVTVALSGNAIIIEATVMEFSGVLTSSYLDVSATNSGTTNPTNTAVTGTSVVNDEVFVCGVLCWHTATDPQSGPYNGYSLLGGVDYSRSSANYTSTAALYKVVSSKQTSWSGTNVTAVSTWIACIASFKGYVQTVFNLSEDTVSVSDAMGARNIAKPLTEATQSIATETIQRYIARILSETSITISTDSLNKTGITGRSLMEDTVTINAETLVRYLSRTLSEATLTISNDSKVIQVFRILSESVSISVENLVRYLSKPLTDVSISLSDDVQIQKIPTGEIEHDYDLSEISITISDSMSFEFRNTDTQFVDYVETGIWGIFKLRHKQEEERYRRKKELEEIFAILALMELGDEE